MLRIGHHVLVIEIKVFRFYKRQATPHRLAASHTLIKLII